jgi:hypothetical protein
VNQNSVGGLFLLLFLVVFVWAVFAAKGTWKLYNFLIILGFGFAGLGIGYLTGVWSGNAQLGGRIAATLLYLLGAAAAYICIRRNKLRERLPQGRTR